MQEHNDIILYKTHQHFIVVLFKFLSQSVPLVFFLLIFGSFVFQWNIVIQLLLIFIGCGMIFGWHYFFWVKSYFIISNEKIIVKVRNGIFSKFHMSIHFKNIRDTAFSKNNVLHYAFDYGTLFARSSAGAVGDLEGKNLPHIEKIYKIVNYLHNISDEERKNIKNLDEIMMPKNPPSHVNSSVPLNKGEDETQGSRGISETLEQAIEKEKNILLNIQGLKEVVVLDGKDRRFIFENEEERNHGVHECLRRKILFAATHDSTFRDPDETIVLKAGEKVVFPVIEFHEIKRKKVSSSSPGLAVHEYLVSKFQDFDDYDATLLIGFDI